MARPKRKDKTRTVLRTGELQRSDGSYQYSWTDEKNGQRKTILCNRMKSMQSRGKMYGGIAENVETSGNQLSMPV